MTTLSRIMILIAAAAVSACGADQNAAPVRGAEIKPMALTDCPADDPGRMCEYDHATLPKQFEAALAGDYQAQRNISYAFTAPQPWLPTDAVQGCAWRMVIMVSRPADSIYDDAGMYRIQCGGLSDGDRMAAEQTAGLIYQRIHGADLPRLPPIPA